MHFRRLHITFLNIFDNCNKYASSELKLHIDEKQIASFFEMIIELKQFDWCKIMLCGTVFTKFPY